MNEFDIKAAAWDDNPMHIKRAEAVAEAILKNVKPEKTMTALEFGAGTGLTSFILKDHLKEITMIDSSAEMVRLANEKIRLSGAKHIKSLHFDLENKEWSGPLFDLIISQMVLHHINDTQLIIRKFHNMLNPGGFLAIADLYPEDGSFHGKEFNGHKGFDPEKLSILIGSSYFTILNIEKCFVINKTTTDNESKQFDVFLLTAKKSLVPTI
jgi:2-polyprenyl-3-methyl-5-hydroxy-6-metoxy-1,4-benzoquinol methylase